MKEFPKLLGSSMALIGMAGSSIANQTGENIVAGSATVSRDGDILTVVTGSDRTIIDWDAFSIGAEGLANFVQPGVDSAVLNRVVGSMPTEILGTLLSNGHVALINPNGILIDRNGVVDTRGFTASTLDVSNEAFLSGQNLIFSGSGDGGVINRGAIIVREGDVFLMGQTVENEGSIKADNVSLAAGSKIVLKKNGDSHLYVEVEASDENNGVENTGSIEAVRSNLRENGNNPYEYAMARGESSGATGFHVNSSGKVVLSSGGGGSVKHSGVIMARGKASGGDVVLEGKTVDVRSGSLIQAIGENAGGSVKIGGGFQGGDEAVQNARVTRVQDGAVIDASATGDGDGGRVIIWSDGTTFFGGDVVARGAGSGAGGFAEVSGKGYLAFRGNADLGGGSLLLDPDSITIQSVNPDIDGDGGLGDDLALPTDLDDAALDFPGATSVITAGAVDLLLAAGSLTLAADSFVQLDASVSGTAAGGGLTLTAPEVRLNNGAGISLNNGDLGLSGDLVFIDGMDHVIDVGTGSVVVGGGIDSSVGGNLNVTAGLGLSVNSVSVLGGDVTSSGEQTYLSDLSLAGDVELDGSVISTAAIDGGGNTLTLDGSVSATTGDLINGNLVTETAATIASGDIGTLVVGGGALGVSGNLTTSGAITGDQLLDIGGDFEAGNSTMVSDLNVDGTSSLGGNVVTVGNQTYTGDIDLTADVELDGAEILADDIDAGGNALTLDGSVSVVLDNITNGSLTIESAVTSGRVDVTSLVTEAALSSDDTVTVSGTTLLGGDVTSDDDQFYLGGLETSLPLVTLIADGGGPVREVQIGGNLNPNGGGIGTINVTGRVDFAPGASYTVNSAGGFTDLLTATRNVDLNGIDPLVTDGTAPFLAVGDRLTVITTGNSFQGVQTSSQVGLGGQQFEADILGGSSYDLVRVATPVIWQGGAGNDFWSDADNWVGTSAPGDNDILVFPQGLVNPLFYTSDNNGFLSVVDEIRFSDVGIDSYLLTGSGLSISNGVSIADGAGVHTLDFASLSFVGTQSIDAATGGLVFNPVITGASDLTLSGQNLTFSGLDVSSINSTASNILLNGNVTTTGAQSYTGSILLGVSAEIDGDALMTGGIDGGGNVLTLDGSTSVQTGDITNADLITQNNATVASASVASLVTNGTVDSPGNIVVAGTSSLGGDVTTTGDQTLTGEVTLTADVELDGAMISTAAINAGGNTLTLDGSVSVATGDIFNGDLTTDSAVSASNVDVTNLVTGATLSTLGNVAVSGASSLGGNVTTTGNQTLNGNTTLTADVELDGAVVSTAAIDAGGNTLTLDGSVSATTGDITNGNLVTETAATIASGDLGTLAVGGGALIVPGNLTTSGAITGDQLLDIGGNLETGSSTMVSVLNVTGTTSLGGNVTTTGNQTLNGNTTLTADVELDGAVVSTAAIDAGGNTLTLDGAVSATTGDITNGNLVTETAATIASGELGTLAVGGGALIVPGNLTTSGAITGDQLLDIGGNLEAGSSTMVSVLNVTGTSSLGGNVTTTGNQTLNGNTTLTADVELDGAVVSTAAIDAGGNTLTLDGAVSATTGNVINGNLVTETAATIASGELGTLAVGGGALIVPGNLTASGAITGDQLLDIGGNLEAGNSTMVSVLNVTGTSSLGGNVTTSGNQTLNGNTTLTADVELDGAVVSTAAIDAGGNTLTLDGAVSATTGDITNGNLVTETTATIASGDIGSLAVGGGTLSVPGNLTTSEAITGDQLLDIGGNLETGSSTMVSVLNVTGTSSLGGNVTTTGNQTLNGNTTLTADVELDGAVVSTAAIDAGGNTLTLDGSVSATTGDITNGNLATESAVTASNVDVTNLVTGAVLNSPGNVTVSGSSTLGGNVVTTGNQTLVGGTTLTADVELEGGVISTAAVDAGGNTLTLDGSVSATTGDVTNGSLVTESAATIANGDLNTLAVGGGALNVSGNLMTSGAITGDQLLNIGGNLVTGISTMVSDLTVAGTSSLGGNVVTTGNQTLVGATTLAADVELDGAVISAATVDGGGNTLTLDGSTSVTAGAISNGNLVTETTATIASGDLGTLAVGGGSLSVSGDLIASGVITGDQLLDVGGDFVTGSTTMVSVLNVAGTSSLGGDVTTVGNQTYVGAVTTVGPMTLTGADISAVNTSNNFEGLLTLDVNSANLVDEDDLSVGGVVQTDLSIGVGDSAGQSLRFSPIVINGNLLVNAVGNINQIGNADIAGTTTIFSSQGRIELDDSMNEFDSPVTLTGDQITITSGSPLTLGDIVTSTPGTGGDVGDGTFTLIASADVTQEAGTSVNVNKLEGSINSGATILLFNEENQFNEVGDVTVMNGSNFYLRDKGRQAVDDLAPALTVTGAVAGEGSVWLVVDGTEVGDREGLTVDSDRGSLNLTGVNESLVLVGGLSDTNGVSGTGELKISDIGSGPFVTVGGGAEAYLLFNTALVSEGGSDLTGVDISVFKSLNFSFDPNERQGGAGVPFSDDLETFIQNGGTNAELAALVFEPRVPSFINNPSFIFTQSDKLDTDTASQATDVASLTSGFFSDLKSIEKVNNLSAEEIAAIRDVSRFEGGAYGAFYGPFAILSYEYDWWLAENDLKPGVRLDEDEKIYNGVYPLYLRKTETGKIVPAVED